MTLQEWEQEFTRLDAEHDFQALARDWHNGQFSHFYRLSCNSLGNVFKYLGNGGIDPCGVMSECLDCLRCHPTLEDSEKLKDLYELMDKYPTC